MNFASTRGGLPPRPFLEAVLRGYPEDGGLFLPSGDADLRPAVYAPSASFAEAVALAAGALFPESIDPVMAGDLADSFAPEPLSFAYGSDILVLDLARGPTASAADYGAAFAAAMLPRYAAADPAARPLPLAAASGRDAAALAVAFRRSGAPAPLVLLCPEEGLFSLERCPPREPSAADGRVLLVGVKGGLDAARGLERAASGLAVGGRPLLPLGAGTPARLAGRALLLVGLFSLARSGVSGDLIVAAPPSDGYGLATGLWDWSWGLPVSAFVSARLSQTARAGGFAAFGGAGELAGFGFDAEGEELLGRFARDYPLGSLVVLADADPETAARESAALLAAGGPALDRGSSFALAASRRALEAGYSGHARIVVPRFADPAWDGEGAGAPAAGSRLLKPDAVIAPTTAALESALRGLL